VFALCPLVACDKDPESAGATCASNCKKSVALACPNEAYSDEATCESQCEEQIAGCSDNAIVQAYLDCVETTPMTCGETTGTATSDQCLSEGLAFFACLQGVTPDTDGGTEGTGSMEGTSGDPGAVEPPPIPTAGSSEIAVAVRVGDTTEDFRCTGGSGQTSSITYQPGSNGIPDSLSIVCQVVEDPQLWSFYVVVLGSTVVDGATIAIETPATAATQDTDTLSVAHIDDGEGFDFSSTANGGYVMQGTLHIDQAGGAGLPMRGSLTATWPKTPAVHGGVSGNEQLGAGAISVAFDLVPN
jgi:hypothetical protein